MLKCVVVHRQDENNVGDIASNPVQYFLKSEEYQTVDIVKLNETAYESHLPVIVGGGGLIGNDFFGDIVRNVLNSSDKNQLTELWNQKWEVTDPANKQIHEEFIIKYKDLIKKYIDKLETKKSPRFFWGGGWNGDYNKKTREKFPWPDWMVEFDKIGVRDWGQTLPWTPCASCMHPALRKSYPIKNDIIFFEHKKQLLKDFGTDSIPRFINSGSNVEQTIELLGSANIILTNSYHGAYWGTLLKKRVLVVGAWGAKFYAMKHPPYLLDKNETWSEGLEKTMIQNNALDECIEATEKYWNDIKGQLK
jgi:hypothetical protein